MYILKSLYSPALPLHYTLCHLLVCSSHFSRFIYFMLISRALITFYYPLNGLCSVSDIWMWSRENVSQREDVLAFGKRVNIIFLIITGRAVACSLLVVALVPIYIYDLHFIAFNLFLIFVTVFQTMCGCIFEYVYSILGWYLSLIAGIIFYMYYPELIFLTEIIAISMLIVFCASYVQIYQSVSSRIIPVIMTSFVLSTSYEFIITSFPPEQLQCFVFPN